MKIRSINTGSLGNVKSEKRLMKAKMNKVNAAC